jgi:6,7-dimethyl-8-ribityllumazine synthase
MTQTQPDPASLALPRFDKPVRLLIVMAAHDPDINAALLAGAQAQAALAGVTTEVLEVPGVLEVPPAIAMANRLADFDGYVALGCILYEGTAQYEAMCQATSQGLMMLGLGGSCVGQAILMAESRAQALALADPAGQDKGGRASLAALHLVAISRKWAGQTKGIGFRA